MSLHANGASMMCARSCRCKDTCQSLLDGMCLLQQVCHLYETHMCQFAACLEEQRDVLLASRGCAIDS